MAVNSIPEKLINFRVFDENDDLMGIASVDLPEIEAMSDTVSGAGIAGEVDSPTLGHFSSMTATINWNTILPAALKLNQQRAHAVTFRGSQQAYDAGAGAYGTVPVRVVIRGIPKTFSLGTLEPGAATDTSQEFEVVYLNVYVNNVSLCEIDKYNFKAVIGGVDALAKVRADLGIN